MYFLPPWSEKTLTPSEYSPAMAGCPGSRRSHAARRIPRRETHSPLAGQLLFIFDDAESEEEAVPEVGGARDVGTCPRELGRSSRGRAEPSSCACALHELPARAHHINLTFSPRPPVMSLGSLRRTNQESRRASSPPPSFHPRFNLQPLLWLRLPPARARALPGLFSPA